MTRPNQPTRDELHRLRETRGASAPAMIRKLRAQSVAEQFDNRGDIDAVFPVRTRRGQVTFGRVEFREIDSNTSCVEVWVGENVDGPPHYRFFNPPTLAEDPQGDIEIEGQRYREDPLAAIAEVIIGSKQ